jgi:pseudouridine-5'-phosphate glycosidase
VYLNTKSKNKRIYQKREITFFSIKSDRKQHLKVLSYVKTLIIMASRKDDKKDEATNKTNPQQQATAAASASINRAIEETRDSIKRTTDETRREIPRYRDSIAEFQRQTVDTTREMADSFLESQRDIANSFQSAWTPAINSMMNVWFPYANLPATMAEAYTRTISTMAENVVTGTRMANNMIVANMESMRTTMDIARENVKDITRLVSNNARAAEEITKGMTRVSSGSSFASSTTGSTEERDEGRQRR